MMDARRQTCIVIRRNNRYLVGKDMIRPSLKWSWSIYEAWRTRDMEKAQRVARITGGIMVLFNPVLGEKKVL